MFNLRRHYHRGYLIFNLLVLQAIGLSGQTQVDYSFDHLTATNGLSSNSVRCMLQDSLGFIWIGTVDGLNRYNGYSFEVFRPDLDDSYSIPDPIINALYEDSEQQLWVGTNSGVSRYERCYNRFTSYDVFFGKQTNAIWEDSEQNLWVTSLNRIYRFDKNKNQFVVYPKFTDEVVTCAIPLPNNIFLIGTHNDGMYQLDIKSGALIHYLKNSADIGSICSNDITAIRYENSSNVWISTRNGVDLFNSNTKSFKHIGNDKKPELQLLNQSIRSEVLIRGNEVWIPTQSGISILNRENNRFLHLIPNLTNNSSLNNVSIWELLQDTQGRVWIGTHSGGINIMDPLRQQFTNDQLRMDYAISAILKDSKARLWLGTDKGLLLKDRNGEILFTHNPLDKNSLPGNAILDIYEDKTGSIWIASWNGGLSKFNEMTRQFINQEISTVKHNKLSSKNIYSITHSSVTGQLLIGSFDGFHILNERNDNEVTNYRRDPDDISTLSSNFCKVVYEDSKANIWIGTDRGLNKFDIRTKKFVRSLHSRIDRNSISSNHINCILEDSKNRLWIGTNNGLNLLIDWNHFERYFNPDDSFNSIQSIIEDDSGNLWISTISGGIAVFNPETLLFENYNELNTYFINEFRSNCSFKSEDGRIYFGGSKGLNSFYPDRIRRNPFKPPVYFTDLKIANQSVKVGDFDSLLTKSISSIQRIVLPPDINVFSVEFLALNYTNSKKNQYIYTLEGFDDSWSSASRNREVTYTNLDPGTYTLKVKASNNDGLWNEKEAKLVIVVLAPWWETLWFRILFIGAIMFSAVLFYKNRIKAVEIGKRKSDDLQRRLEIGQAKEEVLSILSHEIRTPLNSVIGLTHVLSRRTPRPDQVEIVDTLKASADHLLHMVNDILDFNKIQAKGLMLELMPFHLSSVLNQVYSMFIRTAEERNLYLTRELDDSIPTLLLGDSSRLVQILSNLVSNGLKFTLTGGVVLRAKLISADALVALIEFDVQDTGIGIAKTELGSIFLPFKQEMNIHGKFGGTGLGLTIVKSLIEMMGGEIEVISGKGEGSTFKVRIPFKLPNQVIPATSDTSTSNDLALIELTGKRVLYVEDVESNWFLVSSILEDYGIICANATTGNRAIEATCSEHYDLILLDIQLPDLSGYDVAKSIRNLPNSQNKTTPIILFSAFTSLEGDEMISCGANDVLGKPFKQEVLLQKISTLMNGNNRFM